MTIPIPIIAYLVVITIPIFSFRNVLKAVIRKLPQERAITCVPKILGADFGLKKLRDCNAKSPSVRPPRNKSRILRLRQDVMHFLRKVHPGYVNWDFVVRFSRHVREVPVRVIRVGPGFLHDLDYSGLDGKHQVVASLAQSLACGMLRPVAELL